MCIGISLSLSIYIYIYIHTLGRPKRWDEKAVFPTADGRFLTGFEWIFLDF